MQLQQIPHTNDAHSFEYTIKGICSNNGKLERYTKRVQATFQISNDTNLLNEAFRLRYEVFGKEMGIFSGDASTSEYETDRYDNSSLHAFLHINGELATYARMITHNADLFPSEHHYAFPLSPSMRRACVELSRAASVKKWRRSNVVWLGFWLALRYCAQRDICYVLGLSTAGMFNGLKRHNLHYQHIGQPMRAYGYKAIPYIIDVKKSLNM